MQDYHEMDRSIYLLVKTAYQGHCVQVFFSYLLLIYRLAFYINHNIISYVKISVYKSGAGIYLGNMMVPTPAAGYNYIL